MIFICFDLFWFQSDLHGNRFIELSSELDAPILDRGQKNLDFRIFPLGLSNFGWAALFPFDKIQSNNRILIWLNEAISELPFKHFDNENYIFWNLRVIVRGLKWNELHHDTIFFAILKKNGNDIILQLQSMIFAQMQSTITIHRHDAKIILQKKW